MKKIISFSVFGNNPLYLQGIEKNVKLAERHYPGWRVRLYVENSTLEANVKSLQKLNLDIVPFKQDYPNGGLFQRFRPMYEEDVDIWISRDLDSRITSREAAAVFEWEATEQILHVMRDAHNHSYPIMAGMFGMKKIKPRQRIQIKRKSRKYFEKNMTHDQEFLKNEVWPKFRSSCFIHDYWAHHKVNQEPKDLASEGGVSINEAYGVGLRYFLDEIRSTRHPEIFPKTAFLRDFPKNSETDEPLYVGQIVLPGETPAYSQAMRWEYELRGRTIPKSFEFK